MLVRRYAKTLALLLLLPLGWGLSLLPLLLLWHQVRFDFLLPALIAWAALYLLPLPFFLRLIIHKVWFFPGRGEPVLLEMLEFMLLAINDLPNPFQVQKTRSGICLRWHCDDPDWCKRMLHARLQNNYELSLEFESRTRTVVMRDRVRQVDLSLCPLRIRSSMLTCPRFFCHVHIGPEWGINTFEQTAAEDYCFQPQELKSPVVNTILRNGWNVRLELY
ncbi:MAG: hypothetical protein D3923_09640 [Candidatus Electrothrix sp. AR3]|nr:hypothetical protein [Candidatus Electrothrix sp. AR3]